MGEENQVNGPEKDGALPLMGSEVVEVLSNGTPVGKGHRFLPGVMPTTARPFTPETSRQANSRRRELIAAKVRRQAVEAAQESGLSWVKTSSDAAAALGRTAYESAIANMLDKPRDAVHPANLYLRLAGDMPADDKRAQAVAAVQVVIAADVDARLTRQLEELE